jgi:hypothetical protein
MPTAWETQTECPDCHGVLDPIRLIDATDRAMGGGVGHVELAYASQGAQHSAMTGTLPSAGTVRAKLCESCGRIFLYATSSSGGLRSTK